jgi:hypothetical protein
MSEKRENCESSELKRYTDGCTMVATAMRYFVLSLVLSIKENV